MSLTDEEPETGDGENKPVDGVSTTEGGKTALNRPSDADGSDYLSDLVEFHMREYMRRRRQGATV